MGKQLIKEFLIIIQTYKSSGAVERAKTFYDHYSKVEGMFLQIRDIVIEKKKPRRIELNNNLIRYNAETIEPQVYPECFEGIIASYADRFPATKAFVDMVHGQWQPTAEHLRVQATPAP